MGLFTGHTVRVEMSFMSHSLVQLQQSKRQKLGVVTRFTKTINLSNLLSLWNSIICNDIIFFSKEDDSFAW